MYIFFETIGRECDLQRSIYLVKCDVHSPASHYACCIRLCRRHTRERHSLKSVCEDGLFTIIFCVSCHTSNKADNVPSLRVNNAFILGLAWWFVLFTASQFGNRDSKINNEISLFDRCGTPVHTFYINGMNNANAYSYCPYHAWVSMQKHFVTASCTSSFISESNTATQKYNYTCTIHNCLRPLEKLLALRAGGLQLTYGAKNLAKSFFAYHMMIIDSC